MKWQASVHIRANRMHFSTTFLYVIYTVAEIIITDSFPSLYDHENDRVSLIFTPEMNGINLHAYDIRTSVR